MSISAAKYEIQSAPGVNTAFSRAATMRKNPWSAPINADSSAETETAFDTHDLKPGQESLKQRVTNFINNGQPEKAITHIQSALETAKGSEIESILELAQNTLGTLTSKYPHEQGLINDLAATLSDYAPAFTPLIATHDLKLGAESFGAASEAQPQNSSNTGDLGRYMAQQSSVPHMERIQRDDPYLAMTLTPPSAFAA